MPRCIRAFLLVLCLTMSLAQAAELAVVEPLAAADRTEVVLTKIREKGLRELSVTEMAGLNMRLHLEGGAEKILTARQFDVEDKDFDEAKFREFVVSRQAEAVGYFRKVLPQEVFAEYHVVLEDFGEDRKGTISMTAVGSRVIRADVRRWHKLYKGYKAFLADLTSIHEFTHAVNYFVDEDETKKHRELVAVVFESLDLLHRYGAPTYKKNYLKKVTGPVKNRDDVLGDEYRGMEALRHIAHSFITKVNDGVYKAGEDKLAVVERFAAAYLSEGANGAEGFDRALVAAGISGPAGETLTLVKVQDDLFRELGAQVEVGPSFALGPQVEVSAAL